MLNWMEIECQIIWPQTLSWGNVNLNEWICERNMTHVSSYLWRERNLAERQRTLCLRTRQDIKDHRLHTFSTPYLAIFWKNLQLSAISKEFFEFLSDKNVKFQLIFLEPFFLKNCTLLNWPHIVSSYFPNNPSVCKEEDFGNKQLLKLRNICYFTLTFYLYEQTSCPLNEWLWKH